LESVTDNVKEKVVGTAKSVKEGVLSTIGTNDNADDGKDLATQVKGQITTLLMSSFSQLTGSELSLFN
jgi:hypothetical protein